MEDNNSFLIKAIAVTLILILALNVIRTESTKKQIERLSRTVDSLSVRVDSLENTDYLAIGSVPSSGTSSKQVAELTKKLIQLQSKVSTIEGKQDKFSSNSSPSVRGINNGTSSAAPSISNSSSYGRVSVSSKVKVEDRYVEKTVIPQVTVGPEGVVVINITIDPGGNVSRARVGTGTTIKDEDILNKCKEAALKTRFNINVYVSSNHPGTITYTFTSK